MSTSQTVVVDVAIVGLGPVGALQELGCLETLLSTMPRNPGLDFVNAERRLLMRIPGSESSVSGLPASMYFHQPGFDRALRAAAAALPSVEIRLGTEMQSLGHRHDRTAAACAA